MHWFLGWLRVEWLVTIHEEESSEVDTNRYFIMFRLLAISSRQFVHLNFLRKDKLVYAFLLQMLLVELIFDDGSAAVLVGVLALE